MFLQLFCFVAWITEFRNLPALLSLCMCVCVLSLTGQNFFPFGKYQIEWNCVVRADIKVLVMRNCWRFGLRHAYSFLRKWKVSYHTICYIICFNSISFPISQLLIGLWANNNYTFDKNLQIELDFMVHLSFYCVTESHSGLYPCRTLNRSSISTCALIF